MIEGKFLTASSSLTGTTWTSFPSAAPVNVVHVLNNTGTDLVFRRSGDTSSTFVLPTSIAWSFRGLTDSSQLQFRRVDLSNTSVTLSSIEAELDFNQG